MENGLTQRMYNAWPVSKAMKKNCIYLYTLLIALALLFTSCKGNTAGSLMQASGSPGEVLLVMDKDWQASSAGLATKDMLQAEVYALPQVEHWMRVLTVDQRDFNDFLRNTRNIFIVDANDATYSKNSLKYAYDPWANGQLVVTLQTPSKDSLEAFVSGAGACVVRDLFLRHELYRLANDLLVKGYSIKADSFATALFNHHINVPGDIVSYKSDEGFLWMSNNTYSKRMDLAVFSLTYLGSKIPSVERVLELRDSVLGSQIPGSTPESHMKHNSLVPVKARLVNIPGGNIRLEINGLWEMSGKDMMAGPFVSHTFIDLDSHTLYYVEGFIYHPNELKRDLVRRMQAALYSFRNTEEGEFDPAVLKKITWRSVE